MIDMDDQGRTLVEEAYRRALPNIVYASELREVLGQAVGLAEVEEVVSLIKERIASTSDITRKTDLRIFLSQLLRLMEKEKSINLAGP